MVLLLIWGSWGRYNLTALVLVRCLEYSVQFRRAWEGLIEQVLALMIACERLLLPGVRLMN